jgi:GTPase SAR1 family protein
MDTQQPRRRLPEFIFRVLIVGRANAGKTTILQRVCETTESPTVYRGNVEVRGPGFCLWVWSHNLTADQVKLDPSIDVSYNSSSLRLPLNMVPARGARDRRRTRVLQP